MKLIANKDINAVLCLSDGECFFGKGIGIFGQAIGEICFNTSITGYQEIITDPSYSGQIITFTFPHIGNVGCNKDDNEAGIPYCKGLVIRENITEKSNFRGESNLYDWLKSKNLIAICGIDTRSLTKNIRKNGARNAIIYYAKEGEEINTDLLINKIIDLPTLHGAELAAEISTKSKYSWDEKSYDLHDLEYKKLNPKDKKYKVTVIDYGIKRNILHCLADQNFNLTILPARSTYKNIIATNPDGIFLSNGPADPLKTSEYAVPIIKKLIKNNIPIFGICMGHQLISIASGLSTVKMHQGHRGANHPVKNFETNTVEITSQNHGFCASKENMPDNVKITHISLFDNTIQGIELKDKPVFSVQYHPESSPGPHDSRYLFDKFKKNIQTYLNAQK